MPIFTAAGALRRVIHPLWRLSRGMTLGVRGIVLEDDRKVLLVEHTYVAGWHLPGGGVERGETAVEAITRELAEEARVTVLGAPELFGLYANFTDMPRDHVAVYVIRQWLPLNRRPVRLEIARTGFFPLDGLPDSTTPGTRRRLAEFAGREEKAAFW